jgi:hypothetical protein
MQHIIPFVFHGKKNNITVDYSEISDAHEAGFHILNLPFAADACKGYPLIHAYFRDMNLQGYERYCGWIQIIRRDEFSHIGDLSPSNVCYEPDVPEDMLEHGLPYFAYGYPPELFDAPCRNLRGCEKLIWRAYTYLVDVPSRINGYQLGYLAGFTWGYTEDRCGAVSLLDFSLLTEDDWNMHKEYTNIAGGSL